MTTDQFAEDLAAQESAWWWQPRRTHNGADSMSCVLYVPDALRKKGPVTVDDIWREMLVQGLDARTVQVSQISLRWSDDKTPEEQADYQARQDRSASLRERYERETYERLRVKYEGQ